MNRTLWLGAVLVTCVGMAIAGGCGPANPEGRLPISGNVTFQGQPLDQGTIRFTPLEGQSDVGSGAMIQNGSYSLEAHQGLPPGKYRVWISSTEQTGGPVEEMPGMAEEAPKERIPSQYNDQSTLEAEVTAGGDNKFDFDLTE